MNLNELAREVSQLEGRKVELPIAQIKDVLRSLARVLAELETDDALAVLGKLVRSVRNAQT